MADIVYPYLPEGRRILYVGLDNPYMALARGIARRDCAPNELMPNASVIVRDGEVLGAAAKDRAYHERNGCERVRLGCPTGTGYDLCEGCGPRSHGEHRAIQHVLLNNYFTQGADLYMWGHWWCCEPCWTSMIRAGIREVYLLRGSEALFDRTKPGNIVGKQFADE